MSHRYPYAYTTWGVIRNAINPWRRAYNEGAHARSVGKSIKTNPYRSSNSPVSRHQLWFSGWLRESYEANKRKVNNLTIPDEERERRREANRLIFG